jgi:hypothetical protein
VFHLIAGGLTGGVGFWLLIPLADRFGIVLTGGLGLLVGLMNGLVLGLMGGLGVNATLTEAVTPRLTLRNDRKFSILVGCAVVAFAVLGGLLTEVYGQSVAMTMIGFLAALVFAVPGGTWPRFLVVRVLLAARRQLPVRLMPFLQDAYRLGVLRQVGAVYQFRHARLQEHLATLHRTDP